MSEEKVEGRISYRVKPKRAGLLLPVAAAVLFLAAGCSGAGKTAADAVSGDDKAQSVQAGESPAPVTEQEQILKGYRLPIDDAVREEAETDCKAAMEKIAPIYLDAEKGDALNPALPQEAVSQMYDALQDRGCPVIAAGCYYRMGNHEKMDAFLTDCQKGKEGSVTLYKIHTGGGINRSQFLFDGTDMYVVDTAADWSQDCRPHIASSTRTRLKSWKYTQKGWFAYEYCVPEFPEVTEIVNGNYMIRVRPMEEEYTRLAEAYLLPIGYQGNNLFRTDWDAGHMEQLDYNGLYEYLYEVKYRKAFGPQRELEGIPKKEFEDMMTGYLPVTAAQLTEYAVFDEEKQSYVWKRLGPLTYKANRFSSSIPEVVRVEENPDGTILISIDVVCVPQGDDALMRHVLTLQMQDNGEVRYLQNQVTEEPKGEITEYQYRLSQDR